MRADSSEVRRLVERLEEEYGHARFLPRFEPMEELVSCILSQSSSDASSFPAFTRLRERFPDWHDLAHAPLEAIAEVIRAAGLANQKAKAIQGCLLEIHRRTGQYSLEALRTMPTPEAEAWLRSLPGVGPKTAAIVLCFAFGRSRIPVDTHVYRVSERLGWVPAGMGERRAHEVLGNLVPEDLSFRFHAALIQHGRVICQAKKPLCGVCPVLQACPFATAREAIG
jgi:endonuclease-3